MEFQKVFYVTLNDKDRLNVEDFEWEKKGCVRLMAESGRHDGTAIVLRLRPTPNLMSWLRKAIATLEARKLREIEENNTTSEGKE